jgi:ribose transport system substrate-binding protein
VAGSAQDTAADQLPLVQGVIVGNPDALIISPSAGAAPSLTAAKSGSGSSLTQALYVAQENDTKVVLADTSVADGNIGASRITSDNAGGGRIAADNLGRMLAGKDTVAVIEAADAGAPGAARIAAFRSQMAARYPGVTVLATQAAASDTPGTAASLVTGDLKAHRGRRVPAVLDPGRWADPVAAGQAGAAGGSGDRRCLGGQRGVLLV